MNYSNKEIVTFCCHVYNLHFIAGELKLLLLSHYVVIGAGGWFVFDKEEINDTRDVCMFE